MARMTRWWPSGERIYRLDEDGDGGGLMVMGSGWAVVDGEPQRIMLMHPLTSALPTPTRLLAGTVVLLQDELGTLEEKLDEKTQEIQHEIDRRRAAQNEMYTQRRRAECFEGELVAAKELLARHEKEIARLKRQKRALQRALDAVERKRK